MSLEAESRLRRIMNNLFLENWEKDKLVKMYDNTDPVKRDYILNEIEHESESRNFEVRRRLRQIIRDS